MSLRALLFCLLAPSLAAAPRSTVVELGPTPPIVVAPELGTWAGPADGGAEAGAHPLRPVLHFGDGAGLELALPGAGTLSMAPLRLGTALRELPRGQAKASESGLTRLRVSGTWLDVEESFELRVGALKHDLHLGRAALESLGAGDLRASWLVTLPPGVTAKLEPAEGLAFRDREGAFLARVPPPELADAGAGHALRAGRLEWDGSVLTVVVPGAWLSATERRFPLRIDPTVTLFPAGSARTGWVDETGFKSTGAIDSGALAGAGSGAGVDVRGFAEFDTSPVPDSATIVDVDLEVWLSNHDNPTDPAVPLLMEVKRVDERASASATALHAAIPPLGLGTTYDSELLPRTGPEFCPNSYAFRRYDLGPVADDQLESRLGADWFTVGFVSQIVTDPLFDHIDYIGWPESVQNPDCDDTSFPGTRIRLVVEYLDDLPPVCSPGGPYAGGCPGNPVILDGSASFDPEGEPLTYRWETSCEGLIEDGDQAIATLLLDDPCEAVCSVTLTVSDGTSETSCTEAVVLRDEAPPVLFDVPEDEEATCDDLPPVGTPQVFDDCDPDPVIEYLGEQRLAGSCPDSYRLIRRWRARDRCGRVSTIARQEIEVSDEEAPELVGVPADSSASCDDLPPVGSPTARDDCDPAPRVDYLGEERVDGPCPDRYALIRRWQASDRCGNASEIAEQRIEVRDDEAPVLLGVPADTAASCDDLPPVGSPTARDDCDPAPRVDYLGEERVDGPCPDRYALIRRWQASDRCGNASEIAEQRIEVRDDEAPVLLGVPADTAASCDDLPPVGSPTARDDCDPAPRVDYLGEERVDGPCPDRYALIRRWQASDRCGNASEIAEQRIEVRDDEAPVLLGVPADTAASCVDVPAVGSPTARDDCDPAPRVDYLGEERIDGPCPDRYSLIRRWRASDRCGNASEIAEQRIEVRDDEAPVLLGVPADTAASCDDVPAVGSPTARDDCDPAPRVDYLGEERIDGPCPDSYSLIRRWQASDRCGNASAISEQRIEVSDSAAPVLLGVPPDAVVECDEVPPPASVTARDDCDPAPVVAFSESRRDGRCPGEYELVRTWTATDRCGNSSTANRRLSVVDRTPPVLTAPEGDSACLWPPNHRYVCFELGFFEHEASDACSEPVSVEIVGCTSNQPDDARESDRDSAYNGDGHTTEDCVVVAGGQGVCVRSERAGKGPDAQDGRRYGVLAVAVDACGNRSEPTLLGTLHVPHDQSPAADCIDAAHEGLRPNEPLPR